MTADPAHAVPRVKGVARLVEHAEATSTFTPPSDTGAAPDETGTFASFPPEAGCAVSEFAAEVAAAGSTTDALTRRLTFFRAGPDSEVGPVEALACRMPVDPELGRVVWD